MYAGIASDSIVHTTGSNGTVIHLVYTGSGIGCDSLTWPQALFSGMAWDKLLQLQMYMQGHEVRLNSCMDIL